MTVGEMKKLLGTMNDNEIIMACSENSKHLYDIETLTNEPIFNLQWQDGAAVVLWTNVNISAFIEDGR